MGFLWDRKGEIVLAAIIFDGAVGSHCECERYAQEDDEEEDNSLSSKAF